MKKVKLLAALYTAVFIALLSGCAGGGGEKNMPDMEELFPFKTDTVTQKQLYTAGKALFPESLWQTPVFERAEEYDRKDCGATAYFLNSVSNNGKVTKVFVFVGLPEGASAQNKVPGVVLVHGGGGTAFPDWVRMWNKRGYAAVAMDTEGRIPAADADLYNNTFINNPYDHGPVNAVMGDGHLAVESQWAYHAIAAVVVSHSFLRSFPEVDNGRIGITGISYGGLITTAALAYDDRFRFAAPVYGCGALTGTAGILGGIYNSNPKSSEVWDDIEALRASRTPVLFINGNKDDFFTPDAVSESARVMKNSSMLLIHNFQHGHYQGAEVPEIFSYADFLCGKSTAFPPHITKNPSADYMFVNYVSARTVTAKVYYTDEEVFNNTTSWRQTEIACSDGRAVIPAEMAGYTYYVNIEDSDGRRISSRIVYA